MLANDQSQYTILGILGFLRLLLPVLLQYKSYDSHKIIEVYDVCLHLLYDNGHSIINASLDIIYIILNCTDGILKKYLTTSEHLEIVRKRKSLRNVIFNRNSTESKTNSRKSSAETIKNVNKFVKKKIDIDIIEQPHIYVVDAASNTNTTTTTTTADTTIKSLKMVDNDNGSVSNENIIANDTIEMEHITKMNKETFLDVKQQQQQLCESSDEKSLTFSDNEIDSFKSIDFGSNIAVSPTMSLKDKKSESKSLKSQKSTESIGSFINTLLSHPNTGKCFWFLCINTFLFVEYIKHIGNKYSMVDNARSVIVKLEF